MKRTLLASIALVAMTIPAGANAATMIKNVIIMIADGAGYNLLEAARLYGGPLAVDSSPFRSVAMSTYPLRTGTTPIAGAAGLMQDPNAVYNSASNWNTTPVAGNVGAYPAGFAGYEWNRATAPDSGNTMTSMVTGVKTYNNAINVDGNGTPLLTVAEVAVAAGRSAGVVTSAQFGDATPAAAGGAHNISRANRQAIANEMFSSGVLSVIGGAGNPDYTNDGTARTTPDYTWISPALWSDLKNGTNLSGANGQHWTFTQNKADIDAIAAGPSTSAPDRLAMITKAFDGAQQYRGGGLNPSNDDPFATPLLDTTPTLSALTIAALKVLNKDSDGLFLMSESSNTDRASHSNNLGRAIEAYLEFDKAIRDVIAYVNSGESRATWDDTLLIVTADHDHLLFGPDGATNPFQGILPDGSDAGSLPEYRWLGNGHSNQLVPLYAMGAGSAELMATATQTDFYRDAQGRTFGRGAYTDQTKLGKFLLAAVAVPESSTWMMMIAGFGIVGLSLRRAPKTLRAANMV